ncbi:DNA polymerase V, partial [Grifola frondosa]
IKQPQTRSRGASTASSKFFGIGRRAKDMSTTLPLFWHLSSASKKERVEASVKLVGALEHFQAQFAPKDSSSDTSEDDEPQDKERPKSDGLNALNAQDVSYSIRRLVRGLASPRESSRLGFAVALTELLSRIDTVTCAQILALILDSSKTQGSMTGQEERDMLFARLFGITSVIQSGLLLRDAPLPSSASSSTLASSLSSFTDVLSELLILGEKKSWLRESAWWTIGLAIDALATSQVSWKDDAIKATITALFVENKTWTPEKVALALKLQNLCPPQDWRKLLAPTFKSAEMLSTGNLTTLAKILKESNVDDDEESDLPKSGSWKPQVHFVWDMLLDQVLSVSGAERTAKSSFPEFFRIVVDGAFIIASSSPKRELTGSRLSESLFASTASPERKYWGFQVFQKALSRVGAGDLPMLFTKNFMRTWINHLSNSDRYLHKAARQVATEIQTVVLKNPTIGFTLILQLTGVNGSRQFDKLTRTKTVESILTSMDNEGIQSFIDHLLEQVDEEPSAASDIQALNARRAWIIDQLAALVRNGAIPKSDAWIESVLDWLAVHGIFLITKKSEKSAIRAVRARVEAPYFGPSIYTYAVESPPPQIRSAPTPAFSEELRKNCRERLLGCLAELTAQSTLVKEDNKTSKTSAVASDGQFWVSKVLHTVELLEKDTKHVRLLADVDEEEQELRTKARQLAERLRNVSDDRREAARGAELLVSATLLHYYCADEDADSEPLESCIDGASRMFPVETKKSKKSRKSIGEQDKGKEKELPEPVDVLVDTIIGFLENATSYMRAVANQVFSLISGAVQESTIDLILTQLERRDPAELMADEDEDMEDVDEEEDEEEADESSEDDDEEADEEEDISEEEDLELRRKIEEALRVNGIEAATGDSDSDSDEDLMDDEQMLAIDEQLAAAFKARAGERKPGKDVDAQREATHFKNRVLDLLEIFIKKQPTNPLVIRLILPLVELIVSTGPDEKQLADKATGILRSRIGKLKELPSAVDTAEAARVLEELHTRARKAPSSDVLATLNQCSLYLCRLLLHAGITEPILSAYRGSLEDFATRKSSKLNIAFFDGFLRRHPQAAWGLRDDLVGITGKAMNGYRQTQSFHLLHTLINQLPAIGDRGPEILAVMPVLRQAVYDVVSKECDSEPTLIPAQVKEVLKLGLVAVRQTKRVSSAGKEVATIWEPSSWETLATKLAGSERFKTSTGLQAMCKQIMNMVREAPAANSKTSGPQEGAKTKNVAAKRKVDTLDEEDGVTEPKKPKHKKARKAKP